MKSVYSIVYLLFKKQTSSALHTWNEAIGDRAHKTFQFLEQVNGLKMLNLDSGVRKATTKLHASEIRAFTKYRFGLVCRSH